MKLKDFVNKMARRCSTGPHGCVFNNNCPHGKMCKDVTSADWVRLIVGLEKPEVLSIKATCKDCEYLSMSMVGMPLCIVTSKTVRPETDYCDMYEKAAQPRTANS